MEKLLQLVVGESIFDIFCVQQLMYVDVDDVFMIGLMNLCDVMCIFLLDFEYVIEIDGEEGFNIWEFYFWSY